MSTIYAAFSGGKDSTAMVLRMKELGLDFELLFTPTGNELPELVSHLDTISKMVGKEIIVPKGPNLEQLIISQKFLPSWHSRWCTRMIKIVPCIAFLKTKPGSSLAIGLRYDEQEREGLYGDYAHYIYPLREMEMTESDVLNYVASKGITVPKRTDCALCPYQRIGEWYRLWKYNRDLYNKGIEYEEYTQATFRSPTAQKKRKKDGKIRWEISLKDLAVQFESGDKPRTLDDNDEEKRKVCRVCSL